MKKALCSILLAACLPAGQAAADSIIINYRSGKTQAVNLDDTVANVSTIEYRSDSGPGEPKIETPQSQKKGIEEPAKQGAGNGGFRIKWAPPRSSD